MLLWITDTPDLLHETENLLIRTPSELAAIRPQEPMLVVIDVHSPQAALINWAAQRKRATLWWQPDTAVPTGHCSAISSAYSSATFIPRLNQLYHQEGVINLAPNELELVICKYPYIRVFTVPTEFGELVDEQTWELGYVLYGSHDRSLDDIERTGNIIRSRFNINMFYCLYPDDTGPDMLMAFAN